MRKKLAIIGAGKMGSALSRGVGDFAQTIVCDRHPEKLSKLKNVLTCSNPDDAIADADAVLFAVKPQTFDACLSDITSLRSDTLIISIMAGIPIAVLRKKTGCSCVVRAMPNLGVAVGHSVTGWVSSPDLPDEYTHFVRALFTCTGASIELSSEDQMDAFTSISGCGPAYFFLLAEILSDLAHEFGFATEDGETIAREVLIASGMLMAQSEDTPAEWKRAVASKGGVTQEALDVFANLDLKSTVRSALSAAQRRSRELSS